MADLISPQARMIRPAMNNAFNGDATIYQGGAFQVGASCRRWPYREGQGGGSPFVYVPCPHIPIIAEDVFSADDGGHSFPSGTKWLSCFQSKIGAGSTNDFTDRADYETVWVPVPESLPTGWDSLGRMLAPPNSGSTWNGYPFAAFQNIRTSATNTNATRRNNFTLCPVTGITVNGSTTQTAQVEIRKPGGGGVYNTPQKHISPACWNQRDWRWLPADWIIEEGSDDPYDQVTHQEGFTGLGFRAVSWSIDVEVNILDGYGYGSWTYGDSVGSAELKMMTGDEATTYQTVSLGSPTLISSGAGTWADGFSSSTVKVYRITGSSTASGFAPTIASGMTPGTGEVSAWRSMLWKAIFGIAGSSKWYQDSSLPSEYWGDEATYDSGAGIEIVQFKWDISLRAGGRIDIPYWFAATGPGLAVPGGVPSGFWSAL